MKSVIYFRTSLRFCEKAILVKTIIANTRAFCFLTMTIELIVPKGQTKIGIVLILFVNIMQALPQLVGRKKV